MKNIPKQYFYKAVGQIVKRSPRFLPFPTNLPDPPEEDVDALRKNWNRSVGPKINRWAIDYSYYSPIENGAPDDKKYPMVIVLAGAIEGIMPGYELQANCLALWSAEKYQSRFTNGGAFMMIARAPEEDKLYWDSRRLVPSLKAAIDDFIRTHPNIDDSRIYLVGWCLGGRGVVNLVKDAPHSFAASIVIAPTKPIDKTIAPYFYCTPTWLMGCTADEYVPFEKSAGASFNALKAADLPIDFQLTTYDIAPDVYFGENLLFLKNHNMWANLAEDMQYKGKGYNRIETIDKDGNAIPTPNAIEWLCSHQSPTPYEYGVNLKSYTFNAAHFKRGYGMSYLKAEGIDILLGAMVSLGKAVDERKK